MRIIKTFFLLGLLTLKAVDASSMQQTSTDLSTSPPSTEELARIIDQQKNSEEFNSLINETENADQYSRIEDLAKELNESTAPKHEDTATKPQTSTCFTIEIQKVSEERGEDRQKKY
ncbi:MAG: hypothetical protein ACON39_03350 [Coraliomargaritaceae bacterium]